MSVRFLFGSSFVRLFGWSYHITLPRKVLQFFLGNAQITVISEMTSERGLCPLTPAWRMQWADVENGHNGI